MLFRSSSDITEEDDDDSTVEGDNPPVSEALTKSYSLLFGLGQADFQFNGDLS